MKKKTSVSLEESTLKKVSALAKDEERSASFLIEKTVEAILNLAKKGESYSNTLKRVAASIDKKSDYQKH